MNHYDLVSGEPVNPTQGPSFVDPNIRYQQMLDMQNQNSGGIYIGTAGYNNGAPPYGYAGSPFIPPTNPIQTFGSNQYGFGFANPMYARPVQYYDRVEHVDGYNPRGSELLLPANIEEIAEALQLEMEMENEKAVAARNARYQGQFQYNYGSSYYGWNMNYPDQAVIDKYRRKAIEIRKQAMDSRTNLNKHLSRLVHNMQDDDVTEEDINKLYDGYDIKIPAAQVQQNAHQDWLYRLQPVEQNPYARHFDEVHNFYEKLYTGGQNMNEFLRVQGIATMIDNMEEDLQTRRNGQQYYQSDPYRRMLRQNILKRDGIDPSTQLKNDIMPYMPQFKALSESARLLDDGSIGISAPTWVGGKTVQRDEELAHFEQNRTRFIQSLYAANNMQMPPNGG